LHMLQLFRVLATGAALLAVPAMAIAEDAINAPAVKSSVYVFAVLLLFSSLILSVIGYVSRLPLRRQGLRL